MRPFTIVQETSPHQSFYVSVGHVMILFTTTRPVDAPAPQDVTLPAIRINSEG